MATSKAQFGKYSPDGSVQLPLLATPKEILGFHNAETEKTGYPSVTSMDYMSGHSATVDETKQRIGKLFDRKLNESSPEFVEHVKKHGVQVPVGIGINEEYASRPHSKFPEYTENYPTGKVGQLVVQDGHHRLATAHAHAPNDLIPVTYSHLSAQYNNATMGELEGLPSSDKAKPYSG